MLLKKLISKKNFVVLGINSGTSADGLDMAVVKISSANKKTKIKFITGKEVKYPEAIRSKIFEISESDKYDLNELIYLDNLIGKFYGQKVKAFMKYLNNQKIKIDFIASHGQTIRHLPQKVNRLKYSVNGTMQIGSPEFIAAVSGKIVVSDFRQADIASGGEGAPITTPAVAKLFSSNEEPRLIINIGGISNYFYLPQIKSNKKLLAEDCGPGNSILDILSQRLFKSKYDKNGFYAEKGTISERLLSLLLADSFYQNRLKSTGREIFGKTKVKQIIDFGRKFNLSNNDLMASAAEFTARSIALKVSQILKKDKKLKKLYLTGGGRKNIFLLKRLSHHLPDVKILPIDNLGLNGDYIEAVSYAILGWAAVTSQPMKVDSAYKKNNPVLGSITQPPQLG